MMLFVPLLGAASIATACHRAPQQLDDDKSVDKTRVEERAAPAEEVTSPAALANVYERRGEAARTPDCPSGMILVEGRYCPDVKLNCKRYMDPPGRYHQFRCAEYERSECLSEQRVPMRFCIDRDEYASPGSKLPDNRRSLRDAEQACSASSKRVCLESEWNFACEGEELRPYPYGWKRDPTACNADHTDITTPAGRLKDLRAPAEAYPRCVSPFGVRHMAGNVEEFVAIDKTRPARPAMKGAYWQPSRNFCRAAQTAHDRGYSGTETGFRCCADTK
jgi:hypothetical protein